MSSLTSALIKCGGAGEHYPSDQMLQGLSYVEWYAWFGLPATAGSGTGLYRASGSLTPAGQAYRAAG